MSVAGEARWVGERSLRRQSELHHLHGRARALHCEAHIVHERFHDEDSQAANAKAIGIDALTLADWVEAASFIGDFNGKLAVLVRADKAEMAAADVTMFGGVVTRFARSKRNIVYVTAEQPAAAGEGRDFSARFGNRCELARVPALQRFHLRVTYNLNPYA